MRTALRPLAIAAGTLVWTFPSTAVAEANPHHDRKPHHGAERLRGTWEWILASPALGKEDRDTLKLLAPYLDPATYRALAPRQRHLLLRYARRQITGLSPLARCWAPGTPIEVLRAYHAAEEAARAKAPQAPRKANQFFRRWGRTATNGGGESVQGRPITLTWGIVPDGTPIPGDPDIGDSSGPSDLRARLSQIYGGTTGDPMNQPWIGIFQRLFDNISANTGIKYVYEAADDGSQISRINLGALGVRGDIRLGGHDIDGNAATLAYNYFPDSGDMIIDTNDDWFNNTSNNSIRLRNTLEHEHGHGIGMEHVCPVDHTKLMEPFINSNFRGIQFDEIYTLQRWYGDFYEQHGTVRDNDTFDHAAPLAVPPGAPLDVAWMSIDDDSDLDYYSLAIPPSSEVTVRITPSSLSYLEGAQNANGTCTSGTAFNPGAYHDLTLELIGPDRSTILATAAANPAGQLEEIVGFPTPEDGLHYVRVTGDTANLAQLYRLEIEVSPPAVVIALQADSIVSESFAAPNGLIEPGETIELEVALTNSGTLAAANVEGTLSGPAAFTGFDTVQGFGSIAPAGSATANFVFALDGTCGQAIPLELTVTADNGFQDVIPLVFNLGSIVPVLGESFDTGGNNLPAGWTSSDTGNGGGWALSGARTNSPSFSAFAAALPSSGTSSLTSPAVTLGPSGGSLSFRHFFNTEADVNLGFDGGVLEVSAGGGPWEDIVEAGAAFTAGGYNRTLRTGFQNPLPGCRAWSGDSGGWIATSVNLPPSLGFGPFRFRWRLGHDSSRGDEGWYLDDIALVTNDCASTAPLVTLAIDDDTASEFAPLDRGRLTFSVPLPPATGLAIPLLITGSALAGVDATGFDGIILPAGQTSVEVEIIAVHDTEVEGEESLVLSVDPAAPLVANGLPAATILISDTPYGQWAAGTLGLGTPNGPLEDRDGDRSSNLEEYAWQTDGASPASRPRLAPRLDGDYFRLDAPFATLPPDVFLRAETSSDLQIWSPPEIQGLADGFQVLAGDPERYLRLLYHLLPAAP